MWRENESENGKDICKRGRESGGGKRVRNGERYGVFL